MKRISIVCTLAFCVLSRLSAQAYTTSQSHSGSVSSLATLETVHSPNSSFISAGSDGFLVKWSPLGTGEHYQISDLNVAMVAANPVNEEIVIYENNSLDLNRLTVLDWKNFNKRYTKRFKDSITCLSYSANGTYILVGTAAVKGIYILNARTGLTYKNITDIPGIITMAKTSDSEKSAVMYSPSGYLYYYDLKKNKLKTRFSTESALEQPVIFGTGTFQNRFFAGTKGNTVYVIDALNGKTLVRYNVTNPFIFTGNNDYEEGIYFISERGRGYSLNLIASESLRPLLKNNMAPPPEAVLVKSFMGLKSGDNFTVATKNQESVILGTKNGDIYTLSDLPESETYSLVPMTQDIFKKIHDIASDGERFYFLTNDAVYTTTYESKSASKAVSSSGHTNMILNDTDVILWSKDTKKTVLSANIASLEDGIPRELFTPRNKLQALHLYGNQIIYLEGNNTVKIYDMVSSQSREIYSGTVIEDAVIVDDSTAYIATSAGGTPIVSVNLKTGETVSLRIGMDANVVFSLCHEEGSAVYGILMNGNGEDSTTQVFSYTPETKFIKSLQKLNDEDSSVSATLQNGHLYTNLGGSQIYDYDAQTSRTTTYNRSSSMPLKAVSAENTIAVLNKDGSISWYRKNSRHSIAEWHLTIGGQWQEF